MSEPAFPSLSSLPPDEARRVDDLCARFEDAWKKGERPRIEDYRPEVPEAVWPVLLRELAAIESAYRRRAGEWPAPDSAISVYNLSTTKQDLGQSLSHWSPDGEPIPGYRLVCILGKGGIGEVWEARGPGGIPTALKRVPLHDSCGERELEALELLKRVRHPHLLAVHGYWLLGEDLVIGLELADESLGSLLRRQSGSPGLPQEQVLQYLADAAEALDYLGRPVHHVNSHTVRIQHRDVKPANLLLQGGAVKVADFGLAKALKSLVPDPSYSMTPAYAPPEFFSGETAPTSDQYSLGITYYELRTSRLPFTGSPARIMHGHVNDEPDLTGLSEREREIVARALAKNPEHRWASCVKFIGEMARAAPPALAVSPGSQGHAAVPSAEGEPRTATYRGQPITSGLLLAADDLLPIPLRRTNVRAAITAACAEVTVTQVFVNTHQRALEVIYVFPLPEDAAVHGLRMLIGERVIEGVVREKEEAHETYEEAKREGHGAALVEQTTPNIFTTSVANILPEQEIHIEVRYLQPLPFQAGQYRFVFPMVVSPRYVLGSDPTAEPLVGDVPAAVTAPRLPQGFLRGDTVGLEVDLDAGVPLCGFDSPSHDLVLLEESGATRVRVALRQADEIPNRDFVLTYRVAGPRLEHALRVEPGDGDKPGTFLLITTPPVAQVEAALPREIIFVIDRSGSMRGEPLEQAKYAARQLLDRLDPVDAFNIIAFDNEVTPLAATPLSAEETHLRRARAFLDQLQGRGGTEMLEPLRLALQMPSAGECERVRMVVFLTDGSVSGERELLTALRPVIGRSRILAFGIGTAVNRHLINKLTAAGRGFAEFLFPGENIARVVDRTLRRLGHPVLTDVELHWQGSSVEEVFLEQRPDVYLDRPLVVLGRFRGASPPAVTIRGRLAGKAYTAQLEPQQACQHAGGVPFVALWARQRIEELMDRIWEHPQQEATLREQVIELAKRYRLASQFTSFLAVEFRSKAEREQAHGAVAVEIPQYMPQAAAATTTTGKKSLLDDLIKATRMQSSAETARNKDYFQQFISQALKPGQVVAKDAETNIKYWIGEIDKKLTAQLNEIMHQPDFQRLEATWRGLRYLVQQSQTGDSLKIRVLNVSKRDLFKDLEKAGEFNQSALFKKVYEAEYGQLGGQPYGLLVGDYEFSGSAEDMSLLKLIAGCAASAYAPFVAASSPKMFGFERFKELTAARDLSTIFSSVSYVSWKSFRESADSLFVALTLPRVLSRLPYGANFKKVEAFNFEELLDGEDPDKFCWMSAAWAYAVRVTDAYAKFGWLAATRGMQNGGKVADVPVYTFPTDNGGRAMKRSTEIALNDCHEFELSNLGFLPLLASITDDCAVFMGAQSCQKPNVYDDPNGAGESANAALSTKFNRILCLSLLVRYLLVLTRDALGSFQDVEDIDRYLNGWISNFTCDPNHAGPDLQAWKPLAAARVEVRPVKGKPGYYEVVALLEPHFQLEPMTTGGMRLVAEVPKRA
jgi:type VI secretion system protein ImpC